MRQASFEDVEGFLQPPWRSGDALFSEIMWRVLHLAPTDPGDGSLEW